MDLVILAKNTSSKKNQKVTKTRTNGHDPHHDAEKPVLQKIVSTGYSITEGLANHFIRHVSAHVKLVKIAVIDKKYIQTDFFLNYASFLMTIYDAIFLKLR